MTIEQVREFRTSSASQPRWVAQPEFGVAVGGLARWWKALALKRRADRVQRIRIDEMPAYLLLDIGLPPDFR